MVKIGPFTVKAMPGQEMTDGEIRAQLKLVSECAEACEYMTEQREQEVLYECALCGEGVFHRYEYEGHDGQDWRGEK